MLKAKKNEEGVFSFVSFKKGEFGVEGMKIVMLFEFYSKNYFKGVVLKWGGWKFNYKNANSEVPRGPQLVTSAIL